MNKFTNHHCQHPADQHFQQRDNYQNCQEHHQDRYRIHHHKRHQ